MFRSPHMLEDIDQDLFLKRDLNIFPQCLAMYGMLWIDSWIGVWMDGYGKHAKGCQGLFCDNIRCLNGGMLYWIMLHGLGNIGIW